MTDNDHDQDRRFAPEVEAVLTEAGWRPGRWDEERARDWGFRLTARSSIDGHQHVFSPAALAALAEFGGLVVEQSGPGEDVARTTFRLDPELAAPTAATLAAFGDALDVGLFPLGEEDNGVTILAIDTSGRVFALDHTAEWLLGNTIEAALETLVLGRRPVRVRNDGSVA